MAYVLPNPEYDKFRAEYEKANPLTLPAWDAPYKRPALDTDVWNGMNFGDWKAKLQDYITKQQTAWQSRGAPTPPVTPTTADPMAMIAPPTNLPQTGSPAPIVPPGIPGAPQITPPALAGVTGGPTNLMGTGTNQLGGKPGINPALQSLSDNWASLWQ